VYTDTKPVRLWSGLSARVPVRRLSPHKNETEWEKTLTKTVL